MSNKEKRARTLADPEVPPKGARRRFSAAYMADILERADACRPGTGELGALLRREGLCGTAEGNALARDEAWSKAIAFLRTHLAEP